MSLDDKILKHCINLLALPSPAVAKFVEHLFQVVKGYGWMSVNLYDSTAIFFKTADDECIFKTHNAKTILRLLCARLVGLASEHGLSDINPYKCQYEIPLTINDGKEVKFFVHIMF